MLSLDQVTVRFGSLLAVDDVSLDIGAGEIYALAGESGCGKSTLARAIVGLTPLHAGHIHFQGKELYASGDRGSDGGNLIQMVFQDSGSALSPKRTIRQSLLEMLERPEAETGKAGNDVQRIERVMNDVELELNLLERYPHELSGGQRQRVGLARALVASPSLIVADEILSSLDLRTRERLVTLIRRLSQRDGIAFLLIGHDLAAAAKVANRLGVMYLGRLLEEGPVNDVLQTAAHPYTRALLDAMPVADPDHAPPRVLGGEPPSALTPPPGCVFHKRCPERLEHCNRESPEWFTISVSNLVNSEHRSRCHLCSQA